MKPSLALILGAAVLAGCGQPGPLYMPTPPARPAASVPAAPPRVTPATGVPSATGPTSAVPVPAAPSSPAPVKQ